MPDIPSTILGSSQFAREWNKIPDWFQFLISEYVKSDGSILVDISESGVLIRSRKFETLRYVEATEDIASEDTGEVSKLKFDFSTLKYELLDPEHKFKARTDISKLSVKTNERFVVGRFRDGQWQVIPTGQTIVHGPLSETMRRSDTGKTAVDSDGNIETNIFDPGQIESTVELNVGNEITWVRETGLLISFDCEAVTAI